MPVAWSVITESMLIGTSRSSSTPGTRRPASRARHSASCSELIVMIRPSTRPRWSMSIAAASRCGSPPVLTRWSVKPCGRSSASAALKTFECIGLVMSLMMKPTVIVVRRRMFWARGSGWKPIRSITTRTFSSVTGRTVAGALSARETVPTETPAASATSRMVTVFSGFSNGEFIDRAGRISARVHFPEHRSYPNQVSKIPAFLRIRRRFTDLPAAPEAEFAGPWPRRCRCAAGP